MGDNGRTKGKVNLGKNRTRKQTKNKVGKDKCTHYIKELLLTMLLFYTIEP